MGQRRIGLDTTNDMEAKLQLSALSGQVQKKGAATGG